MLIQHESVARRGGGSESLPACHVGEVYIDPATSLDPPFGDVGAPASPSEPRRGVMDSLPGTVART